MAAQGYIGRAPGESSVVVARQTFTSTGITTNFTFASGYEVGYVDVYLNGARLIEGSDYTATDGSVVGLSTNAIDGDVLELVAYKAFNVSNVTGANGDFSVPDRIVHKENTDTAIRFPQADTFTVETAGSEVIRIDANGNVGIGTTNTLRVADPKNQSGLNVGFITANSITAAAGSFGSLNVSGTLSYEDVANQDVVGFATFQKGIIVQGAGSTTTTLNVTGVTTMTGDANFGAALNIPDAITHVGDTNTKIRFPAADTFTVETSGSERLRVNSLGEVRVGSAFSVSQAGVVTATSFFGSGAGLTGVASTDNINTSTLAQFTGGVGIADSIFHIGDSNTVIRFPTNDTFTATTAGTEAFRVDSSQRLLIGTTALINSSTASNFQIANASGPRLCIARNDTSVAEGNLIGALDFYGNDSDGTYELCGRILAEADADHTDGSKLTRLTFYTAGSDPDVAEERLRIDSGGRVLIGHTDPAENNNMFEVSTTYGGRIGFLRNDTTTSAGNNLGMLSFYGNDSNGTYQESARIQVDADLDHATGDKPGRITFLTSPDGSNTVAERLRIDSSGAIGVGGANFGSSGQVLTSNGSGSAVTWEDASGGISTQAGTASGIVTSMFLTDATDHKVTATGICTITTTQSGTEGQSHTIRVVNSGIATVGFSTYFLFPSGSAPSLPTADGAVSLISFTVHDSVGAGCTQLLAGVSVNFS